EAHDDELEEEDEDDEPLDPRPVARDPELEEALAHDLALVLERLEPVRERQEPRLDAHVLREELEEAPLLGRELLGRAVEQGLEEDELAPDPPDPPRVLAVEVLAVEHLGADRQEVVGEGLGLAREAARRLALEPRELPFQEDERLDR